MPLGVVPLGVVVVVSVVSEFDGVDGEFGLDVFGAGGVVVGVPDSVGASVGVAGAELGALVDGVSAIADIARQSSQLTAQSQMSPSA